MTNRSTTTNRGDPISALREVLLQTSPDRLERLAGQLLGRLLAVPVRFARKGDQRGGDAGVSGSDGRHLILEARRYRDTSLDERCILGEIEQAATRDPDLEAWLLVTTREVPEQVENAMFRAGLKNGIGTIVIDWQPQPLPKLAALAAHYPESFEAEIGAGHDELLTAIKAMQDHAITLHAIESELKSWALGYEAVRNASHAWLRQIWRSRGSSKARFRQDVAGGSEDAHHVRREDLIERLDAWLGLASAGRPGALVGPDGVGKTWAAIDWLQSRLSRLPVVVLAPASSMGKAIANHADLIGFAARYLHNILGVRDAAFWEVRVRRLLERPVDEGPPFLFFFDGLNQLASYDWLGVLQLQNDDPFHEHTLILLSARTAFFRERLQELRPVLSEPYRIDVRGYDPSPGGELDQKLAMEGLSRDDFSAELLKHAAVPRLFNLVVQLGKRLGDVSEITVHRLLWAYGASTIAISTEGAFDEDDWRRFILDLAEQHPGANRTSTVRRVKELSADASMTPDHIYRRVSSVIDGMFTKPIGDGEIEFTPDFVRHALGLALVKRMELAGSKEDAGALLEGFLDPIEGYDECAEILRAATTIALQRGADPPPFWLGRICTLWIQTQNLPEDHLQDLAVLAPELVTSLLDAIEDSDGHALSTARYMAINALAGVDHDSRLVAKTIAERGARWQRFVSLERRGIGGDVGEHSSHAWRRKRLQDRIGVDDVGEVTVVGCTFQIVDHRGEDLPIAAAQLLQGRPLSGATAFFETGAIHMAVVGPGGAAHDAQSWLNVLNSIDPEDTAQALREVSAAIELRPTESGVHPQLNKRIASLLLWRTGYTDDATAAWKKDPKIDHWILYLTDYLPDPSRSCFRLERRHATLVLGDTRLSTIRRIERARDALLDPSYTVPQDFVDAIVAHGDRFDFSQTNIDRSLTRHDYHWKHLSLALARCAPAKLAEIERKRIRSYASRPQEQRYGTALAAPMSMLLVGRDESEALRILRERGVSEPDEGENVTRTNLLIAEIQCLSPVEQIRRVMNTGLTSIDLFLGRACVPPTMREIDELLDDYEGDKSQLTRLASVLGEHDLDLSERAFEAFFSLLEPGAADTDIGAVWVLLALSEPARLGTVLDEAGWEWAPSRSFVENIMGSIAISAARSGTAFQEFASRIAPAKLLGALTQCEYAREDVALAVDMLTGVLFGYEGEPPDTRLDILHEQDKSPSRCYEYTVGDLLDEDDGQDRLRDFLRSFNEPERHAEKRWEMLQAYICEVKEARRTGAYLFRVDFSADDFDPILDLCPHTVDRWLEGLESESKKDFARQVGLAEGFYVALCEALLQRDPPRGIALWRGLRKCLRTRFIGHAGIDRLIQALFAAPPCAEVESVMEEIFGIDETRNDEDLMNLIMAARHSDRTDWLRRMVERDEKSRCPAHQRRAVFLKPVLSVPEITGDAKWPSGVATGVLDPIHESAWILGQREAFARHWLRHYAEATTPEAAHACWRLFTACADRRARTWMRSVYESHMATGDRLDAAKRRFAEHEAFNLKHAMTENEKSWSKTFAGRNLTRALRPWNSER